MPASAAERTITAEMSVADVVQRYPQCRPVLDRYGLKGCGGAHGPQEPLAYFAAVHQVNAETLVRELNEAAASPAPSLPLAFTPGLADIIYRRFFKAGVAVVLSVGCFWGALNLFSIGARRSFGSLDLLPSIHAHANAMIFGWIGLFVMGFAYQSFPRFRYTTLWSPRLANISFVLMIAGIVLRTPAQLYMQQPLWRAAGYMSAFLQLAATLIFIVVLGKTARSSPAPAVQTAAIKPQGFRFEYFMGAAFLWFAVSALLNPVEFYLVSSAAGEKQLLRRIVAFFGPYRDVQLLGFASLIIAGVSMRMVPAAYGTRTGADRKKLIFWLMNGGLLLNIISYTLLWQTHHPAAGVALQVAYLMVPAWGILLARQLGIFGPVSEPDRSLKFIRAAYVWLIVAGAMLALFPAYNALTGQRFSHAWLGGYRHAFTVGFISLMIVGVSSKVAPILSGLRAAELNSLWPTFVLLNAGNVLRVSTQVLTDFIPGAYTWMGISGFIEVTGLALWGFDLWRIMNRNRAPQKAPACQPPKLVRIATR